MPTWYEARVARIEQAAPQVRRYWLEVPELAQFDFKAGQFVTFDLPISERRRERWRSYSIASAPAPGNGFELCIVHLEGGKGSGYFFDEVAPGSRLRFKGPDGAFTLPERLPEELVMVCTGTGIAPFRSMLQSLRQGGQMPRRAHLIFGTRRAEAILYRAEMEALAREWPAFRYDVALSRQPDWPGHQGYVHGIYEALYAQPDPQRQFYLCGWSNMVDEATARLKALGYAPGQIRAELYG